MKIQKTTLDGVLIIEPAVFTDSRGYFFESFNSKRFEESGIRTDFVQDNQSESSKGVLRGLHFQSPPYEQGKLVRVVSGAVLDVVVDIRPNSSTFGKSFSMVLDATSNKMLWIPPGFAHGFLALDDRSIFLYKCTEYYNKASESGIIWNDPELNIDWGMKNPIVSDKDKELPTFQELTTQLLS
jgi:dTDP-4-dehydrorhamnose 3,5-epimerase